MQKIDTFAVYQISAVAYPGAPIAYVNSWETYSALNLSLSYPANPLPGASPPINVSFYPSQQIPSFWNICFDSNGVNYCMDQYGNNKSQPIVRAAADYEGQQWNLTSGMQQDGTTVWQMQSDFAGPSFFLAAYGVGGQNLALSSNAPVDETLFVFIEIGEGSSAAASKSSAGSTIVSPTSSSVTQTPTNSSSQDPASTSVAVKPSASPLPKSAIIGLALGATAFVIVVVAVSVFFTCWIRRKRLQRRSEQQISHPSTSASNSAWTKTGTPSVEMQEVMPAHELGRTEWKRQQPQEMPGRDFR